MPNEITLTDQFVRKNLDQLGLTYDEQGSSIKEIKEAFYDIFSHVVTSFQGV